jgi:hypothetical protein
LEELNLGANTVDNLCSDDGLVGFFYEVQNGDVVDFTVTPGTIASPSTPNFRLTDPCGVTNVTPPLTCIAPGTIIYVQAGNGNACPQYGTFTITVTDLDNNLPNDVCTGATMPNVFGGNNELACGETGTFMGNSNACPDPEASACFGATTEGLWYSFTTDDKLLTMTISGGQNELFSGTCGALTSLGCNVTNFVTNPLTTYYLLVGPTGMVTVEADQNIPGNDDCTGALLLTSAGLTNQTNVCADNEDITGCNANDDNVVWYTFMMPAYR